MTVTIRGQSFCAAKSFREGTDRTLSPEVTLATIQPYFPSVGLTRLSQITHLDRIGIPVTQAIRPNSSTLTTASGKGLTLNAALVSAAMESLELYCAENFCAEVFYANGFCAKSVHSPAFELSYRQLTERYECIPLEKLPLSQHSLFHIDRPEWWCMGWDLLQQREVAVPLESVILDYKLRQQNWSQLLSFEMSSNGLASGNHLLEAIASGLYELIERDAITCSTAAQHQVGYCKPKVNLETIASPIVKGLLEQLRRANLIPFLFDCTIDTAVPVYEAVCYAPVREPIAMGQGYGAHLDPEIAMIRALTEAAQSRAVAITGTRDDFFPAYYTSFWLRDNHSEIDRLNYYPDAIDAGTQTSEANPTFEADIEILLTKLQQIGCQQVIVVDITPPEWKVKIVRVIVPGLEGYRPHDYRLKHRANQFVRSRREILSNSAQQNFPGYSSVHRLAGG